MPDPTAYEFGPFRLEPSEHKLRAGEAVLPLTPRACDLLLQLLRHRGHLLLKQDLMERVWPESFVEEGNLTQTIYVLRRTLASVDPATEYIETVPRKGYRFRAEVCQVMEAGREEVPAAPVVAQPMVAATTNARRWQAGAVAVLLVAGGIVLGLRAVEAHPEGTPYAVTEPAPMVAEPLTEEAQPLPVAAVASEQRPFVARRAYARGTFALSKRTQEGVRQAITRFQEAIRLDGSYAPAYAGLADAYAYSAYYNFELLPQREA
ncbi:MAG: winged helix-turn-helix domain-containing protein [Terriglobales bacterium]